jgi:hypothetical protein
LVCGAAVAAFVALRFSASVFHRMVGHAGSDLPRPAILALAMTRSWVLIPLVLLCIALVGTWEIKVGRESHRLLVHVAVLFLLVLFLAVSMWGFFVSFYIPDVQID